MTLYDSVKKRKTFRLKFYLTDGTFRYDLHHANDLIDASWDTECMGAYRFVAPNGHRAEIVRQHMIDRIEFTEEAELPGWTIDPWTGDPVKIADSASE